MDENKTLTKEASAFMVSKSEEAGQAEGVNFSERCRKNATPVLYYLYRWVHNVADAEGLTSQTFVTALENLSRLVE